MTTSGNKAIIFAILLCILVFFFGNSYEKFTDSKHDSAGFKGLGPPPLLEKHQSAYDALVTAYNNAKSSLDTESSKNTELKKKVAELQTKNETLRKDRDNAKNAYDNLSKVHKDTIKNLDSNDNLSQHQKASVKAEELAKSKGTLDDAVSAYDTGIASYETVNTKVTESSNLKATHQSAMAQADTDVTGLFAKVIDDGKKMGIGAGGGQRGPGGPGYNPYR